MLEQSFAYAISPPQAEGERLDFVFHHVAFEPIREFRSSSRSVRVDSCLVVAPEYGLSESGAEQGEQGFLNVQHISKYGDVVFDPAIFLAGESERKVLKRGDLLIARTGFTLGKTAAITSAFDGFAFGSFCLRFRLAEDRYLPEFVARFLNTDFGRMQTLMLRTGSDKPNINSEQVRDIHLPDLDRRKQKEVLQAVAVVEAEAKTRQREAAVVRDGLAGSLLREIGVEPTAPRSFFYRDGAEGRTLAFAASADALADRLSYLHYHPSHAALLTAMGAAVKTVPLADVVREPIRRGVQPTYDDDADRVVLKTVDIRDGWVDYDGARRVTDEFFEANEAAQVRRGDVLVTATGFGSMGKAAVYDRDEPALYTGELIRLRPRSDYDPHFLAFFLRSAAGSAQFDRWFSGSSGQIHVYEQDLERFVVPSPEAGGVPLAEQRRIASEIEEQEREARRLEAAAAERREDARRQFEALVLGES